MIIEYGADIDGKDYVGDTYLSTFVYDNDTDMTAYLIEKGADVNVVTDEGKNILTIAKEKGYLKIIDLLINAGATQ